LATPDRHSRKRKPHPYLAPELMGPRFSFGEQIEVYSFGILMYYLATGIEPHIPANHPPESHRSVIHEGLRERNPSLVHNEPRILDIIGRSISRDPADHPRMADICSDLESINRSAPATVAPPSPSIRERLASIAEKLDGAGMEHSYVLVRLL
jgi:hypothetical protein